MFPSEIAAEAVAAMFHTSTVSVYPSNTASKGIKATDFTVTYPTPTARFENAPAHIEPISSSRAETEDGAADRVEHGYVVKIAPDVGGGIVPGDRVRVVTCDDDALQGRDLTVVRVEGRSGGFSRRVWCRDARQMQRPGL